MKKIVFYTDTPMLGGAENQMLTLARFLDKAKYEIVLACSNYHSLDPWVREWGLEGFKHYVLRVAHKHDPRHFTQLKRLLKWEQPDLLHVHLWNPGACRYAFRAAKALKIPVVTTEHDPFALKGVKLRMKRQALKLTRETIAISEANKKMISEVYPETKRHLNVVHNGIDTTWFFSQYLAFTDEDVRKMRKEYFGANDEDKVVLSLATLHPRKGLKYLIEVAKMYGDSFVKFVIAGEGPQQAELKALIRKYKLKERVIMLDRKKSVPRLLKAADIFVLPSLKEAFGLVYVEAMTAGLPIVGTNAGGVPEIIEDGKTGLLVEPKDALALKQAIERFVVDEKLAEKCGEAGLERVKELFDAKVMAERTAAVYEKVVA